MSAKRKPSYLLHKPTGQARVRIRGKDIYLGTYGSPESRDRYDDLVADWLIQNDAPSRFTMTVDDLCLLYLNRAREYYRLPDGSPTSEIGSLRSALRYLVKQFGTTRAREFSPSRL